MRSECPEQPPVGGSQDAAGEHQGGVRVGVFDVFAGVRGCWGSLPGARNQMPLTRGAVRFLGVVLVFFGEVVFVFFGEQGGVLDVEDILGLFQEGLDGVLRPGCAAGEFPQRHGFGLRAGGFF